jgi:hypothetical protein
VELEIYNGTADPVKYKGIICGRTNARLLQSNTATASGYMEMATSAQMITRSTQMLFSVSTILLKA